MQTVPEKQWPDEMPTAKKAHVPSTMIAFASRVDRLAWLALEQLQRGPADENALSAAVADLVQLRALAARVL